MDQQAHEVFAAARRGTCDRFARQRRCKRLYRTLIKAEKIGRVMLGDGMAIPFPPIQISFQMIQKSVHRDFPSWNCRRDGFGDVSLVDDPSSCRRLTLGCVGPAVLTMAMVPAMCVLGILYLTFQDSYLGLQLCYLVDQLLFAHCQKDASCRVRQAIRDPVKVNRVSTGD